MFRTVLAVLLASALLAISMPVIDSARVTHAETQTETSLQRLDGAATALTEANDVVPEGQSGARRYHTLSLPRESWGSAGLDALRFPPPSSKRRLAWRVTGGNWTTAATSARLVGPPDGLTLRGGGRTRLVLTLEERRGRAVVVVNRPRRLQANTEPGLSMGTLRETLTRTVSDRDEGCGCVPTLEDKQLVVDASTCDGDGILATEEACRATVVETLTERDATDIRVRTGGIERVYGTDAAALLVAAGRFVDAIRHRDDRLAERARRDPLGAAREATGRAGAPATIAAETGLAVLAERIAGYEECLAPLVGLTISDWRVDTTPPADAELTDVRDLKTGDTARIYQTDGTDRYVLSPLGSGIDDTDARLLSTAYDRLADGMVDGGERAPRRAVRQAADTAAEHTTSLTTLGTILQRHTQGHGLLSALFADVAVSDAFVTAPVAENPLRIRVDDRTLATNVCLTERGGSALAARYRRESGRGFSRADPTLDAAANISDRQVRVAGVTEPVSDGVAFAFRAHDRNVWTLPALVGNGTLTVRSAALLSLVVERGGAMLVAGPRGAGKTTLLGALLPELPPAVRAVIIEDTPELPVGQLQQEGRDVQALRASQEAGELSATEAVRTALRLGDGALVVGEIRGKEAQSLYEAMRVGANSEAVLGTVHGDGADAVYDRVVDDLGVPATSFGVTDAVVTLERTADGRRRLSTIEEVADREPVSFNTLFERKDSTLASSGRLERGNSRLLETVSRPEETYADVQAALGQRSETLAKRVHSGVEAGDKLDGDGRSSR